MKPSNDDVPLREYLESRISDLDRLTEARFVTHRTLLDSQAEKVALALASADKAIIKQETATNERLHLLNELRAGVATTNDLDGLERRVNDLKERLDRAEGKGAGLQAGWGYMVAGIGLVVLLVNFAFFVATK